MAPQVCYVRAGVGKDVLPRIMLTAAAAWHVSVRGAMSLSSDPHLLYQHWYFVFLGFRVKLISPPRPMSCMWDWARPPARTPRFFLLPNPSQRPVRPLSRALYQRLSLSTRPFLASRSLEEARALSQDQPVQHVSLFLAFMVDDDLHISRIRKVGELVLRRIR